MGLFFKKKKEDSIENQLKQINKESEQIKKQQSQGAGAGFFKMTIADVFTITGRGTVVTGTIEEGSISTGDTVYIENNSFKVSGIEMFRKITNSAKAGDNVGLLINTGKLQVSSGQIIRK